MLAVGDRVELDDTEHARIAAVLPRRNELARVSGTRPVVRHVFAANVDRAVVVASWRRPPLRTGFVDRCVAAALAADIAVSIVLNKSDLAAPEERTGPDAPGNVYRAVGFDVLETAVSEAAGIDALSERLRAGTSILVGQSGVGKSSLLNAIQPGLALETGTVSEASNKGRHTTTHSRLIELAAGGAVVDSPGVRSFGLEPLTLPQLLLAYPELAALGAACRFSGCTHVHEPDCRVREAADSGEVVAWRYDNYVRILESL